MRRLVAAIALLTTALAIAPALAKTPKTQRGSFEATAYPLPYTWNATWVAGVGADCSYDGVEGVHKVTKPFKAPAVGTLTVSLKKFTGDWDAYLIDSKGKYVGTGGWGDQVTGAPGSERVFARIQAGETLQMVVCNSASTQTTVRVDYEYVPGLRGPAMRVAKGYRFLAPNQRADMHERVPVNIVLVGYEPRTVPAKPLVSALPKVYRPIERSGRWYGIDRPAGLTYTYDYDVTYTDAAYENRFFAELRRLSVPTGLTEFQRLYNAQKKNTRTVTSNHLIDGPSVERWLAKNPPAGVNTRENTVFLVNWLGRKDFRFHLYSKMGELVTGTNKPRGAEDWAHGVAWGGSTPDDPETGLGSLHRIWFHDLSAGPEAWSDHWMVDTKDLDGDGKEDYRMPPIWEYVDGGYRDKSAIVGDLAKIVRYVAINLLFTPSPLYPVAPQAPHIPDAMDIDHNFFQLDPSVDANQPKYFDPKFVQKAFADLMPLTKITADKQDLNAADPKFLQCYASASQAPYGPSCHPQYRYPSWADPFVHAAVTRKDWADDKGKPLYEAAGFTYTTPEVSVPEAGQYVSPCFAYADDNWRDGTQSFVHQFIDNKCANSIGLTDIFIHEFGHHVGMSHPHDGFDYERGVSYSAWWSDEFYYAAVGDEVSSVMSYQWYNNDFSQFDRDNRNRWLTAAYVTQVNTFAGALLKKRQTRAVRADLRRADDAVGAAHAALRRHDYLGASKHAKAAYDALVSSSRRAGVTIRPSEIGTTAERNEVFPSVPDAEEKNRLIRDEFTVRDGVALMCKPGLPVRGLTGRSRAGGHTYADAPGTR